MAYEGELLTYCPADMFDFSKAYAVIVSGGKGNPYGHMLLNTGGKGGKYFQVVDLHGMPKILDEVQFQKYMSDNKKTIITVMPVKIPHPEKSQAKLEEFLSEKWWWGGVWHNCESLVEEIVRAGGGPKLHHGKFLLPLKAANICQEW